MAYNIIDYTTNEYNSLPKVEGTKLKKGGVGYRVVIKCTLREQGQNVPYELEFDKLDSINVSATSSITQYPIAEGYFVADHMYRDPINISISGTYSLYGNRPQEYNGQYNDRLTNIQDIFEKIKNQGAFCTIITLSRTNNDTERYKTRKNMVLNSIDWTQNQASLDFTFRFTEVLVVDTKEISSDWESIDPDAPNPTDAKLVDFTDEILDWSQVSNIIDDIMLNTGRAEPKFLDYYNGKMSDAEYRNYLELRQAEIEAQSTVIGGGVGVVAGASTGALLGSVIPGIGTGIGAIVGGLVGLIGGGYIGYNKGVAEADKEVYDDYQYLLTQDDIQNKACLNSYNNFKSNILKQVSQLEKAISCWAIPTNEPQELMLYINDYYYVFYITKNNTNGRWYMDIKYIDGNSEYGVDKETNIDVSSKALSDINVCEDNNMLFKTEGDGYEVYLLNKKLADIEINNLDDVESDKIMNDLTNYLIVISSTPIKEYNTTLKQIIEASLEY